MSMKITPQKINSFMFFKLPLAWLGGVRVKSMNNESVVVRIKHQWINQNPYKSMFWAVQGMAAEMTTGVLVINAINKTNKKFSMLVTKQEGSFTKKATGLLTFESHDGQLIDDALQKSIKTGEGQKVILSSKGVNSDGITVSEFSFEWSIKVKL